MLMSVGVIMLLCSTVLASRLGCCIRFKSNSTANQVPRYCSSSASNRKRQRSLRYGV